MSRANRKLAVCLGCGDPREIAAKGLCFTCYRRQARAAERAALAVGRHNPALGREERRVVKAFGQIITGLADLAASRNDVYAILEILRPYLRVAEDVIFGAGSVNIERKEFEFTVHGDADNAGFSGSGDHADQDPS